MLTEPCPYCAGSAVIKSSSTICYEILSEVKKIGADLDGQTLVLRVNPDIARITRRRACGVQDRSSRSDATSRFGPMPSFITSSSI